MAKRCLKFTLGLYGQVLVAGEATWFCVKLPEASSMSIRANARQLQDGSDTGPGWPIRNGGNVVCLF